jgi:hypothetical protein
MLSTKEYARWFCEQIEKDNSLDGEPCAGMLRGEVSFSCSVCKMRPCHSTVTNRVARYNYFKGVLNGRA